MAFDIQLLGSKGMNDEVNETFGYMVVLENKFQPIPVNGIKRTGEVNEETVEWEVVALFRLPHELLSGEDVEDRRTSGSIRLLSGEEEWIDSLADAVQDHLVDEFQQMREQHDGTIVGGIARVALLFEDWSEPRFADIGRDFALRVDVVDEW